LIISARAMLAMIVIAFSLSAVGWTQSKGPATRPLALTDVTVIDVERGERLAQRTVVIRNGRIDALGATGTTTFPECAEVVSGRGQFLIPGLWDMHVHLGGYEGARRTLSLLLTNGITGVRDMASPLDDILRLRQEVRDGVVVGPRLVVTGPLLQGPLPPQLRMPLLISVETTAQAATTVDMLQRRGVDFIKVQDALPRDIYLAIAEAARRTRLPVAGHIPPTVTASEAADAGQKSIEHLGGRFHGVYVSTSRDEQQLLRDGTRMYAEAIQAIERKEAPSPSSLQAPYVRRLLESYDEQKAAALWKLFVRHGTWQCPTLVTRRRLWEQERERLTDDDQRAGADMIGRDLQLVFAMHRAGGRLLAGTDLPLVDGKSSLPDELALLVQAGLTPVEALRTATRDAAEFLGQGDQLGTIAKGKYADAVLLEGDPLLYIANVKRIVAVITAGRLLRQPDLERPKSPQNP
jgi:cytosine/adenosine deaminase-related metal-dependent hydrolase